MLTSETLFIASELENLLSGDISSSDIVRARKLADEIEELAESIINGKVKSFKFKKYNFDSINELLESDYSDDDLINVGENLLNKTDLDFADLIPKIQEIRSLLRDMLPNSVIDDALGVRIIKPSLRDQSAFLRIFGAVDNPLHVLARISNNSFTSSELSILRQVYPELLDGFTNMLLTYLANYQANGKDVIQHTKAIGIKRYLGENIRGMVPQAVDNELQQEIEQKQKQLNVKNFEGANRMTPESEKDVM